MKIIKIRRIVCAITTAFGLLATLAAAECGPFHCDGEIPGQGPACYCDADGLLCGHDPFRPCTECPLP